MNHSSINDLTSFRCSQPLLMVQPHCMNSPSLNIASPQFSWVCPSCYFHLIPHLRCPPHPGRTLEMLPVFLGLHSPLCHSPEMW